MADGRTLGRRGRRLIAGMVAVATALVGGVVDGPGASPVVFADADSSSDEFWLMFTDNLNAQRLALFIAGDVATTGEVSGPGMTPIPFTVTPGQVTEVVVPLDRRVLAHDQVEALGVRVTAVDEVTVYGYSDGSASTDAFLGLPTDVLGLEYIVLDTPNTTVHSSDAAEFGIVATQDGTTVTITLSSSVAGRAAGVPYSVLLDEGETYQVKNLGSGSATLSGSTVVASAPVAVFGGNRCTNLPVGDSEFACDHVVEQLPPLERWGSNFVTVPLSTRSGGDSFAFVAQENGTDVFVDGGLVGTYDRGEAEFLVLDGVREWSATKPILLAQNSNSTTFDNAANGDPFMMLVPPIEQFLSSYTFATVQDEIQTNFVNIVVPTLAAGSLLLDGQPLDPALFSPVGTLGYSGGSVPVTAGTHTVEGSVGFGLASYGFGSFVSYGYAGGVGQRDVGDIDRWQEGGPALSTAAADVYAPAGLDQSSLGHRVVYVEERPDDHAVMVATRPGTGFGGYADQVAVVPNVVDSLSTREVGQVRMSGNGDVVAYTTELTADLPGGPSGSTTTLYHGSYDGAIGVVDLAGIDTGSIGSKIDLDRTGSRLVFSARPSAGGSTRVYLYDASTSSVGPLDGGLVGGSFWDPSISDDGRWVSFTTTANLDAHPDDDDGDADIFVFDRQDPGATRRISRDPDGGPSDETGSSSGWLNGQSSVSDDGRFVAFVSTADDLVDRSLELPNVLLHDRDSDQDGVFDEPGETSTTQVSPGRTDRRTFRPTVSSDGRRVSWVSRTSDRSVTDLVIADRPNPLVSFALRSPFRRPMQIESVVDAERSTVASITGFGNRYSLISRDDLLKDRLYRGEVNLPTSRFSDVPSAVLGMPRVYRPVVSDPVDVGSGSLVAHHVDLTAPGGSRGLAFERSYDSGRWFEGVLGLGWVTNWESWLNVSFPATPTFVSEHGRPFAFQANPDGTYARPPELLADLVDVPGGYELRWFDGRTWQFDAGGILVEMRSVSDPDISILRDATGLIDRLDAANGEWMSFEYGLDADGETRLTRVLMSDGRESTYRYDDTTGVLVEAATPDGTTTYGHDAEGRITQEADGTGVVRHSTEYDATTGRVIRQTLPTGEVTTFAYDDDLLTTTTTDSTTGEVVTYWFDSTGRLVRITDPAGSELTTTWSADGQPAGSVDRLGHERSASYDENGNLTSLTDPVRGTTTYTYDALNRVTSLTEPTGATTTMTYDGVERTPSTVTDGLGGTTTYDVADGLVLSVVDADGVTTSYSYDARRRMVSTTNGLGDTWTFGYDAAGRRTSESSPLGHTTTRVFDDAGRLVSVSAADGGVTTYQYDADGRVLSITDPTGAVSLNSYDPVTGLLATTTDPAGRVISYTYDSLGQLVAVTNNEGAVSESDFGTLGRVTATRDPLGRQTAYAYDANGNRTEVVAPDGGVTTTEFDSSGRITALEDPIGRRTTHDYDEFGRLVAVTQPDGTGITYEYDLLGRRTTVTGPDGGVTSTTFTPAGRTDTVTDPEGGVTSYGYDGAGRVAAVTDPNLDTTTVDYDPDGRRAAVTTPTGLVTSWEYDPVGRITSIVDPAGVSMTRTYTLRGEVASEKRSGDGAVAYAYNADGTLASVTDALGNTTTMTYDAAGRRATRVDATGAVESWQYNAAGELVAQIDRQGNATSVTYDARGRISQVADPSGRVTTQSYNLAGEVTARAFGDGTTISYAYDVMGRRTSMTDATGTTTYTYDAAGRPIEVGAPGGTLGYTYDLAGRRTGLTYPDGTAVSYTYDAAGRLLGLSELGLGAISYSLDGDGRLVRTDLPDGATRDFAYSSGRLTDHVDQGRATSLAYDDAGRIASLAGADNHTYTYDDAGQLTEAVQDNGTFSYTYGPRGEIATISDPERTRTFTHDAAAQIATIADPAGGNGSATYDAAGRLIEEVDPNGTVTTYAYDARGLLVEIRREENVNVNGDAIPYPEPDPDRKITGKLQPIFECWSHGADGDYVAWWGFENKSKQGPARVGRTVPLGPDNNLSPAIYDGAQPERFGIPRVIPNRPGRTAYGPDAPNAFATRNWDGTDITWVLDGRDAIATIDPDQQCDTTPPPPTEPDVTIEARQYDGDGSLTAVEITTADGTISRNELLWDPTTATPQIVTWGDGSVADNLVYGYQREAIGSSIQSYNVLGDGLDAGGEWSPYGPVGGHDGLAIGYRGELEATATVHLRARDLRTSTATFVVGDPLDGVAGTPTLTNPYHYADNEPVTGRDPWGLRPTDGSISSDQPWLTTLTDRPESDLLGYFVNGGEAEARRLAGILDTYPVTSRQPVVEWVDGPWVVRNQIVDRNLGYVEIVPVASPTRTPVVVGFLETTVPGDRYFSRLAKNLGVAGDVLDVAVVTAEVVRTWNETNDARTTIEAGVEGTVGAVFSGVGAGLGVAACLPAEAGAGVATAGPGAVVVGLACGAAGAWFGDVFASTFLDVVPVAPAISFLVLGEDDDDPCDGFLEMIPRLGGCLGRALRSIRPG